MNPYDWDQITDQLKGEWSAFKGKEAPFWQRWQAAFQHLPYDVMRRAIVTYANEHTGIPTVNALDACLPRGYSRQRDHGDGHLHLPDHFGDGTILCNTCGAHLQGCACTACRCPHTQTRPYSREGKTEQGIQWLWCLDCAQVVKGVSRHPRHDLATMYNGTT